MSNVNVLLNNLDNQMTFINSNLNNQSNSVKILQDNITNIQYNLDNLFELLDEIIPIAENINIINTNN